MGKDVEESETENTRERERRRDPHAESRETKELDVRGNQGKSAEFHVEQRKRERICDNPQTTQVRTKREGRERDGRRETTRGNSEGRNDR